MALIKVLPWKGFEPEYWFITEIFQDLRLKKTRVGLALYKSQAERAIDKAKTEDDWAGLIGRQNYDPTIHQVTVDGVGHSLQDLYALVKANTVNTYFNDAVNDVAVTDYPAIPATGAWLPTGSKWNYNGTAVQAKVGHFRTTVNPTTTPPLFSLINATPTAIAWAENQSVIYGDLRTHSGTTYKCIQAHTTQADWTPNLVPALWEVIPSVPGVWQAGIAVLVNEEYTYTPNGLTYKVLQSHTTQVGWEPPNVPALWQQL